MNLLSNLPATCLDVLMDVPVQGGQEKYEGKNMDAIQVLLEFLEKRIDKVNIVIIFVNCHDYISVDPVFFGILLFVSVLGPCPSICVCVS